MAAAAASGEPPAAAASSCRHLPRSTHMFLCAISARSTQSASKTRFCIASTACRASWPLTKSANPCACPLRKCICEACRRVSSGGSRGAVGSAGSTAGVLPGGAAERTSAHPSRRSCPRPLPTRGRAAHLVARQEPQHVVQLPLPHVVGEAGDEHGPHLVCRQWAGAAAAAAGGQAARSPLQAGPPLGAARRPAQGTGAASRPGRACSCQPSCSGRRVGHLRLPGARAPLGPSRAARRRPAALHSTPGPAETGRPHRPGRNQARCAALGLLQGCDRSEWNAGVAHALASLNGTCMRPHGEHSNSSV